MMPGDAGAPSPQCLGAAMWRHAAVDSSPESSRSAAGRKRTWEEIAAGSSGSPSPESPRASSAGWGAAAFGSGTDSPGSPTARETDDDIFGDDLDEPTLHNVGHALGGPSVEGEGCVVVHGGNSDEADDAAEASGRSSQALRVELRRMARQADGRLMPALDTLLELLAQHGLKTDENSRAVALRSLTQRCPLASTKATAAINDTSAKGMSKCTILAASAFRALVFREVRSVVSGIIKDVGRLENSRILSVTEKSRYDETPMRCRVVAAMSVGVDGGNAAEHALQLVSDFPLQHQLECSVDASPAKLLQTELSFSILIRVREQHFLVNIPVPTPIQSLQRNTAECVLQALRESTPDVLSSLPDQGIRQQRFSVTDRGSGMIRAERGWTGKRPQVTTLHMTCDVHRCSLIRDRCLSPMEHHVRGMIHMALGFREAGATALFRKALRRVIAARFRFQHGRAPVGVLERNQSLLALRLKGSVSSVEVSENVCAIPGSPKHVWAKGSCIPRAFGRPTILGSLRAFGEHVKVCRHKFPNFRAHERSRPHQGVA